MVARSFYQAPYRLQGYVNSTNRIIILNILHVSWDVHRNPDRDPAMQFVTKSMTEQFRNQNCLVVADSAFESMGIMEWGAHTDNKIAYCMTYGGNKICHPDYFSSKKSTMYKHFKNKEKRGATLVTHSDTCTFTFFRDSSVMRLVDNDLDFETMTPRKIRRFNKKRQGDERWKGIARVNILF